MGRAYKRYTRQFKQEAMDLVRVRGYGVAHAARDLGVPTTTLNMWLEKAGWVRPAEGPVDPDAAAPLAAPASKETPCPCAGSSPSRTG